MLPNHPFYGAPFISVAEESWLRGYTRILIFDNSQLSRRSEPWLFFPYEASLFFFLTVSTTLRSTAALRSRVHSLQGWQPHVTLLTSSLRQFLPPLQPIFSLIPDEL